MHELTCTLLYSVENSIQTKYKKKFVCAYIKLIEYGQNIKQKANYDYECSNR